MFVTRSQVPGSRALGWDTMLPTSSCGTKLSATAFGHTGFTGTSLWIDPEREVYVVLLTNRVNPTRENNAIRRIRPALHDAVMETLNVPAA
jgi:CubicO group peptidase (beta-lactamase class C family)